MSLPEAQSFDHVIVMHRTTASVITNQSGCGTRRSCRLQETTIAVLDREHNSTYQRYDSVSRDNAIDEQC